MPTRKIGEQVYPAEVYQMRWLTLLSSFAFVTPSFVVEPLAAVPECSLPGARWPGFHANLSHYAKEVLARGCDKLEKRRPRTSFRITGRDTGYFDHWFDKVSHDTFWQCHGAARDDVLGGGKHLSAGAASVGIFAMEGFLKNREIWATAMREGQRVAVFSECALGRQYRPGIDVSMPEPPYPILYVRMKRIITYDNEMMDEWWWWW
jgi:hypothetical protein